MMKGYVTRPVEHPRAVRVLEWNGFDTGGIRRLLNSLENMMKQTQQA